jgi:rare lipoprotein A (peptidoglycan hydrolase)
MPDRYRNLTHGTAASDSAAPAFLRGWLAVALLLALGLTGCHKKKPKTPRSPQAHAAIPAPVGSIEEGLASWYGPPYHGRQAADGEIYDMENMTAAHRTLPFQTWVRVTNRQNGLTVEVRITDRGPFVEGRIIDLSKAAARRIQLLGPGVSPVRLEVINPPSQVLASAPPPAPANAPAPPAVAPAPAAPAVTPQPAPPASTTAQVPTAQPPIGAPTQPAVPLPPDTINGRDLYGVQVGVFAVYENAVRLRDQYSIDYGPAQLVIRQGAAPNWRVLVGSFENEAEAQQLAQRIRSEKQQPVFVVHLDPPPPSIAPAPAPRPASGRKPSPMPQNPGESPQ